MANPLFPDITGQEYDPLWARQMAEQDIPRVPAQYQQAPDLNIGPVRLNGAGLDSAALAVLGALQNQRQPQNALGSFAQGLAGGLAGGRVRQMQGRQAANEDERKRVVGDDIERRKQAAAYGRSLAQHRWTMQRDAAKEAAKAKDGDGETVLTPQMHADAAKNGIILPKERIGQKVKWSELTAKKSQRDPVLDEISRLRADQLKREGDAQEGAINQTVDDIVNFRTDPTRIARDKNFRVIESKANESLRAAGSPYTLQELQTMWNEKERFYKTADNQRFTGFRQAAYTVNQHLRQFEDFYNKYQDRAKNVKDIRAFNKGLYVMAKEGFLGPDAQADAIGLDVIAEILPKEVATVVAGGRAPYEKEISHADAKYITPFLRRKASAAQIASIRSVLKARIEAQQKALPFAGGKKNPYLIEVSGIDGWDAAEQETPVAGEKKKSEADLFNERK